MADYMRPTQSCMPYRSLPDCEQATARRGLVEPLRRTRRLRAWTKRAGWISPTPEETCPAGLLSGGGLAVVSAVPAGPWLILMCLSRAPYFTALEIFEGGNQGIAGPDPGKRLIAV